jgi:hypothetical protein
MDRPLDAIVKDIIEAFMKRHRHEGMGFDERLPAGSCDI